MEAQKLNGLFFSMLIGFQTQMTLLVANERSKNTLQVHSASILSNNNFSAVFYDQIDIFMISRNRFRLESAHLFERWLTHHLK